MAERTVRRRVPLASSLAARRIAGLAASLCLCLCLAACSPRTPAGPLEISFSRDESPAVVRVGGLSSRELGALSAVRGEAAWQDLLTVRVTGADLPVAGAYVVAGSFLEFRPAFPFDAGRPYEVRFNSAPLPQPRTPPVTVKTLALPAAPAGPLTEVVSLDPASNRWPANILRFYVHFSAPMSRTSGAGLVHLVDDSGEEVPEALLHADVDFWNDDHTRYTVFFDPGRVKRGILPNRMMGRALEPGARYAIVVDAAWPDAHGRPLGRSYRHELTAGPPVERALDLRTWTVQAPRAGSSDPVVVAVPHGLDHALLQRALGVAEAGERTLQGQVAVGRQDTEWRFTPAQPWRKGRHEIVVASILEDPAGNRINRAFEVESGEGAASPPEPDEYRVPFDVQP